MGKNILGCDMNGGEWGISIENFGLEMFTGFERIRDRAFKGVLGTQKFMIELDGSPFSDGVSEVLKLVSGHGVTKVGAVIRRNMRTLGDRVSRWFIVPRDGEVNGLSEMAKGKVKGNEWVMWATSRDGADSHDLGEQVPACIVWRDGIRVRWALDREDVTSQAGACSIMESTGKMEKMSLEVVPRIVGTGSESVI